MAKGGIKLSIEYLTGKDYPWLCDKCREAIDTAYDLIIMTGSVEINHIFSEYIGDNEGPCMLAYDKGLLCYAAFSC
tara:strand:+ start:501 stop:728 length:228 start_codon:yes stop_codon:yes gene_type:complete